MHGYARFETNGNLLPSTYWWCSYTSDDVQRGARMIKIDWKMIYSLRKNKENASFSSSSSSYMASVIKWEEDVKITYYGVEEEVKGKQRRRKRSSLEKSRRIPSAFWDLWRNLIFLFSHGEFEKVDVFFGPNGTTHAITS